MPSAVTGTGICGTFSFSASSRTSEMRRLLCNVCRDILYLFVWALLSCLSRGCSAETVKKGKMEMKKKKKTKETERAAG